MVLSPLPIVGHVNGRHKLDGAVPVSLPVPGARLSFSLHDEIMSIL